MKKLILFISALILGSLGVIYAEETEIDPYIPAIIEIEEESDLAELESQGVVVWYRRGNLLLSFVPNKQNGATRIKGARNMQRGRKMAPAMDVARTFFGADKIQSGEGLPRPYTGKGVVVGLFDIGIDPNHIAFLDADGNSRVKKLVNIRESHAERTILETPEEIAAWTSDDSEEWHGTHVLNIMAGSYKEGGYSGMAPDAEIVAASSQFYDVGILASCEEIISYAKRVGKPAVINLSLRNSNGPHDGTSLMDRYLEQLGNEAVICVASGNEGNTAMSYRAEFTEDTSKWRARVGSANWTQFQVVGQIDAWSANDRPVGIRLLVFDEVTGKFVYEGQAYGTDGPFDVEVSSKNDADFGAYIDGRVLMKGYLDESNGRWVTEGSFSTSCDDANPNSDGRWAAREIGFEFFGEPGVKADICLDAVGTRFMGTPSYPAGGSDMSISDLCASANVVSVGMYNTRSQVPDIINGMRQFDIEPLTISRNSSYGTLLDGRVLPHTVGPGAQVVSACNSDFVQKLPELYNTLAAATTVDGKDYYWICGGGSSMSTPYVAGCVATWIEAIPSLDVDNVLEAILATNTSDVADPENPRHGNGWIRPYDALKYLLASSGICTPGNTDGAPSLALNGDMLEILDPTSSGLEVTVYSLAGMEVARTLSKGEPVSNLSVSHLASGAYIAVAKGPRFSKTLKFIR